MQRGTRLFNDIVYNGEKEVVKNPRGRNVEMLERRNEMLFYRYYYYSKIQRLSYSDVLDKIVNEFCLTDRTIINLVQENTATLKRIFSEKPDVKFLNKKYSFFNWINKN